MCVSLLSLFNDLREVFLKPLHPKKLHGLPLFVNEEGMAGMLTAGGIAT